MEYDLCINNFLESIIIMQKYHFIINRFIINSSKNEEQYFNELMEYPYSDEQGWGYRDVFHTNSIVSATLQKKVPIYYNIWNEEIRQIERKIIQIIKEVQFEIDFNNELIIVEGTNTQLNLIKQSFRQLFWNEFVYEQINMLPADYIQFFSGMKILTSIDEISINDFRYKSCMIGRYIAKPLDKMGIMDKLIENTINIIQAKIKIWITEEECPLSISSNSMILESSEVAKDEFLNLIKKIIK